MTSLECLFVMVAFMASKDLIEFVVVSGDDVHYSIFEPSVWGDYWWFELHTNLVLVRC